MEAEKVKWDSGQEQTAQAEVGQGRSMVSGEGVKSRKRS